MDSLNAHKAMLVWDAHRDVAYEAPLGDRFLQGWLVGVDLHLARLQQGGVDAQILAICVAPEMAASPTAQALKELDVVLSLIEAHPDQVVLATTTADVLAAKGAGKIALLLGLEGAEPIMTELGLLRIFYRLGFRNIGLTWNFRNAVADGGYEGPSGGGLTQFGRAVVQEMNRLGMMVDITHMTLPGMYDVLRLSERPVILSHGTTSAVRPGHARAYPDELLAAIAQNGGVFGVTTIPEAVASRPEEATLERFLDHLVHAVQVMGIDHVGIGGDFDVYQSHLGLPEGRWLKGLEEADRWPNVTAGLFQRGYTEAEIRKIMGENLLRVFGEVIG
jgi:membrane dipeptidase